MSNQIEMYYSTFSGTDTRSNKLLQNPKTFRRGSKNFRYDFQDQIINRQGFQRKDSGAPSFVDIFEYKYRDVDTGAAIVQILGVATDGHLYKMRTESLRFVSHDNFTSVSVFFDEEDNTFKLVLNADEPVTIDISDSMTLAQLETALDAVPGISVSIVDDTGATVVSSTKLAYLLDCVIENNFEDNPVYYWQQVVFPDSSSVPFPTTLNFNTSANYEGISSVNLNNVLYITDGGFPMKYDGKAVYRAGVPTSFANTVQPFSTGGDGGFDITAATTPAGLTSLSAGTYKYLFRFGFTDFNGATVYGLNDTTNQFDYYNNQIATDIGQYSITTAASQNPLIKIPYFKNGPDFGVFSCRLNGDQLWGSGPGPWVIAVDSGHNILPGMNLMIPANLSSVPPAYTSDITYSSYYAAPVTAVTANTITVSSGPGGRPGDGIFSMTPDNTTINGYYTPAIYNEKSVVTTDRQPFGAFVEVYRSKRNVYDTFYFVGSVPMPRSAAEEYSFYDQKADADLKLQFDESEGGALPRACKYLSMWQNQIVQAGSPVNESLANAPYPSWYATAKGQSVTNRVPVFLLNIYSQSHLCDFQSVYWADALTPEGFPQDGLHEFAIDTKFADRVTGIAQNKDTLFAFKERSTAVLTGQLADNDVVMEVLESDAGCSSHRSIEEVRGHLIWLDGINGFFSCVAGRLPENIGFPIQDYQKINLEGLDYSKANASNFRAQSLYVCSVDGTTFVFDYADNGNQVRSCWYIWNGFTGKSVLATSTNKLLIWDGSNTLKMKLTGTKYDHGDHKSAIEMVLNTAWLTQGRPTIDKHYIGLWINSIQGDFTLTVKQYGNFLEDLIGTQTNVYFLPEAEKKFIKAQVKATLPKLSSISFGMEHSETNKAVKIQGYELQYSPDFATGEPRR